MLGGDPTGVRGGHDCRSRGEVLYNGGYFCGACGRHVAMTSEMYAGLFDRRYPAGDFHRHPNFNRALYERGRSAIDSVRS